MQKIKLLNYTFHIIYQPSSISILMCKHHQKQTIIQALWSFQIIQNLDKSMKDIMQTPIINMLLLIIVHLSNFD